MTTDVTALNSSPSPTMLLLGTPVRCADGDAGTVEGIVINPNTGGFEYLLVGASDQHQHLVPRGRIQQLDRVVTLNINCGDLQHRPTPEQHTPQAAGLVTSNLDNLCIATAAMPVVTTEGETLGQFAGLGFAAETDYAVHEVILGSGNLTRVHIQHIDRTSHEELRIVPVASRERTIAAS